MTARMHDQLDHTLCADTAEINQLMHSADRNLVCRIHIDVMDGRFVPSRLTSTEYRSQ